MLTIVLKEGANPVTFNLEEDVINIGRSKENKIILKNIKCSRRHARIERIGATYQVTDLGSGNGTKVNGAKIDFHTLKQGDEIKIGDAILTLKSIDEDADAMDATDADDEIKIADDADDHKLEIVGEDEGKETEKIAWSEAETEVQAPSVKAKPAAKPGPAKPAPGKPGAAPAGRPMLKKPLGRQAPK